MNLREWALARAIRPRADRWDRQGKLPVLAKTMGTPILVGDQDAPVRPGRARRVPYARVQECVLPLGAKHLEAALEAQGRRIVVDASEVGDDLVRGDDLSVPVHGGACQRAAS